ncbi:MAG: hypothetical protein RLZZ176_1849 [Cyanobacteriota bacterium]
MSTILVGALFWVNLLKTTTNSDIGSKNKKIILLIKTDVFILRIILRVLLLFICSPFCNQKFSKYRFLFQKCK